MKAFEKGENTSEFATLLFHYARYLMICSSKPGTASNLQGIWNNQMRAPWSSNYTVNINTEMNYWMAESCNLGDCHTALFELIDRTVKKGKITAQKLYGLEGWVSHHNIDIWGNSGPGWEICTGWQSVPVCFVANEFSVALQAYVGTLLLYVRWGFSERQGIPGNAGSRSFLSWIFNGI